MKIKEIYRSKKSYLTSLIWGISALPIFISIGGNKNISFNRTYASSQVEDYLITLPISLIMLLFLWVVNLKYKLVLILSLVVIYVFSLLIIFSPDRIKYINILIFWISFCLFYIWLNRVSIKNIEFGLYKVTPIILIFFQIIVLITNLIFKNTYTHLIEGYFSIYNYEQYYSFAVLMGLVIIQNRYKILSYTVPYYAIGLMGAYHSENRSAEIIFYIYPVILLFLFYIKELKIWNRLLIYSIFTNCMIIILLPLIIGVSIIASGEISGYEILGGRGSAYVQFLENFNILGLIFPTVMISEFNRDPHSLFFQYLLFMGFPLSICIISLLAIILVRMPVVVGFWLSIIIGASASINESLSHPYLAILFSITIASYIKLNKHYSVSLMEKN